MKRPSEKEIKEVMEKCSNFYIMKYRCLNCNRIISIEIPKGEKATDNIYDKECNSCGVKDNMAIIR